MPQGSFKGKQKALVKGVTAGKKKAPTTEMQKRKNRPIQKKNKTDEVTRLKKMITKNVNKAIEEQIRGIASDQKVHLSKKKDKAPEGQADANRMPPKQ